MHQQATVIGEKEKAFLSSTNGTGSPAGRKNIYTDKFAKDLPKFNGECDRTSIDQLCPARVERCGASAAVPSRVLRSM
eukprot:226273-Hanusia_phi.AAC.1